MSFLLPISIFFIIVSPANAGILSFVGNLFGKSESVKEEKTINSQNVAILHAALNSDPNPAKGGGDITIVGGTALLPDSGPLGTIADIEENAPTSEQISVYVVRKGDSISQIAKMFNVTPSTIVWANDLNGGLIREGQTLVILPVSGVSHTVKQGDTVASIAKKYRGDVDEILQFNGLTPGQALAAGMVILVPDGEGATLTSGTGIATSKVRGTNGPSYAGYYIRPVNVARKSQGLHGYNGVDLAAPIGTPVLASASGDVIISRDSGWNGGYGKYVVVNHSNGTQTLYAHMSEVIVGSGWHVVQGQVIGYVGNTGKSTGSHLHFEIRGAKNPF